MNRWDCWALFKPPTQKLLRSFCSALLFPYFVGFFPLPTSDVRLCHRLRLALIVPFPFPFLQVHLCVRPLLTLLGDFQNLNLSVTKRLSYLTQLFPTIFNEKLCLQLMEHLKKWLEYCINAHKSRTKLSGTELKLCAAIIDIFPLIPAASKKLIKPLTEEVLNGEKALLMEVRKRWQ